MNIIDGDVMKLVDYELANVNKENIDSVESIIMEYINKDDGKLEILDKNPRPVAQYRGYYTGVTVQYIHEYLFNNEYNFKFIFSVLINLANKNKINLLKCGGINDIVFENFNIGHGTYEKGSEEILDKLIINKLMK